MMISRRSLDTHQSQPDHVPPIQSDASYASATATLDQLRNGLNAVERDLNIHSLEGHFASGLRSTQQKGSRDAQLWERLQRLKAEAAAELPAVASSSSEQDPVIAAGFALIAGQPVSVPETRDARRARLERDKRILEDAVRAANIAADEIREDASIRVIRSLKPAQAADLRELLNILRDAAGVADRMRDRAGRLAAAGYDSRPGDLVFPPCAPVTLLGSEAQYNSWLNRFARSLEALGIKT